MVNNGLNYHTVYKWAFNGDEEQYRNTACFSTLYSNVRPLSHKAINSGRISIKIYFDKEFNQNQNDNYCLLNDEELNEYFDWIKRITKFNLKISKTIQLNDNLDQYSNKVITVKFTKKTPYELKLICALVRNLYECPYNIMVKAAFLMEDLAEFEGLDLTQRLCVAIDSILGYNTGHSTFCSNGVDFYNDKSLRKRYCKAARTEYNVNGFMLNDKNIEFNRYYYEDIVDENTEENIFDTLEENYISDEFKKVLIRNYKIIKKNYGE